MTRPLCALLVRSVSSRRLRFTMRLSSRSTLARVGLWLALLAGAGGAPPLVSAQATDKALAALLAEQKWPEALAALDRLLAARPNDTKRLMDRGAVLSNLGRNEDALAAFGKVVALQPELPAAHNNMAVILAALGRTDEARAALERAIRAQPGYATAHENLGDLYAHLAADAYRQALRAEPALKSAATKLELAHALLAASGSGAAARGAPLAAASSASSASTKASAAVAPGSAAASTAGSSGAAARATHPDAAAPRASDAASTAGTRPQPAARAAEAATADDAVQAAVREWARAWSARDVEAYLAAYAPEFKGSAADPQAWRRQRAERLAAASRIEVRLTDLRVRVDGNRAEAVFEQSYDSDVPGSRARTGKTLKLQRVQDRWLIREEIRR